MMSSVVVSVHVHEVTTDCMPEFRNRNRGIKLMKNAIFTAVLVYVEYQWEGRGRIRKLETRGHNKIRNIIRRLDE